MIRGVATVVRNMFAMALAATLTTASSAMAQDEKARLFASHALALRKGGVTAEAGALAILAQIPGMPGVSVAELWPPAFENMIVKLGRLRSPAPVALYYNPLLDVAVFSLWQFRGDQYRVASVRALPGERLADAAASVTLQPSWTRDKAGPMAALRDIPAGRLASFRKAHPAAALEGSRDGVTFAAAADHMRAVLPRLAWNMAMRVQWAAGSPVWLDTTLGRIDDALAARDAAAIRAGAPDTDAATASALARLPAGFAAGLRLDMTLDAGGNDRLVVASLREDGRLYVFALCRLSGGSCGLRRLFLTSLIE